MANWGKLQHGLMYLTGTLHTKRYLRADILSIIVLWVDSFCDVHWDSKGHNRAIMSMGKDAMIMNISRKQKNNIASSTELELVSIVDVLGILYGANILLRPRDIYLRATCSIKTANQPPC